MLLFWQRFQNSFRESASCVLSVKYAAIGPDDDANEGLFQSFLPKFVAEESQRLIVVIVFI